jgi:hypothetical protein
MKTKRRDFLKWTSLLGLTATGSNVFSFTGESPDALSAELTKNIPAHDLIMNEENLSIIGQYGPWAVSLNEGRLPSHSFRKKEWANLESWKDAARKKLLDRMAIPNIGTTPKVTVKKQYTYDSLHIEELSWQLPYGRATDGILLKPANATGRLPAILAFHDHGGNKYFGTRKITKTSDQQHPLMVAHQQDYYSKRAWANEIAKRGYVVLVPDAFTFGTRRVMMQDVPNICAPDYLTRIPKIQTTLKPITTGRDNTSMSCQSHCFVEEQRGHLFFSQKIRKRWIYYAHVTM